MPGRKVRLCRGELIAKDSVEAGEDKLHLFAHQKIFRADGNSVIHYEKAAIDELNLRSLPQAGIELSGDDHCPAVVTGVEKHLIENIVIVRSDDS